MKKHPSNEQKPQDKTGTPHEGPGKSANPSDRNEVTRRQMSRQKQSQEGAAEKLPKGSTPN